MPLETEDEFSDNPNNDWRNVKSFGPNQQPTREDFILYQVSDVHKIMKRSKTMKQKMNLQNKKSKIAFITYIAFICNLFLF